MISQLSLLDAHQAHEERSEVADALHRYRLDVKWGDGPRVVFVGLNPSTANAEQDDPTLRRMKGFARAWGYGSLSVVNLYPWRATDPADLWRLPVSAWMDGGLALARLRDVCEGVDVVPCWGAPSVPRGHRAFHDRRAAEVLATIQGCASSVWALGWTQEGHPRHPLYVKADTVRQEVKP